MTSRICLLSRNARKCEEDFEMREKMQDGTLPCLVSSHLHDPAKERKKEIKQRGFSWHLAPASLLHSASSAPSSPSLACAPAKIKCRLVRMAWYSNPSVETRRQDRTGQDRPRFFLPFHSSSWCNAAVALWVGLQSLGQCQCQSHKRVNLPATS